MGEAEDLAHAVDVGEDGGGAEAHGLQERHGESLGDGGHDKGVGGREEGGGVGLLAPEMDVTGEAEGLGEGFEFGAGLAVAYDPEVEGRVMWQGEGDGAEEGVEGFFADEAADEEEGERSLLRWVGYPVNRRGAVVDEDDSAFAGEGAFADVDASDLADAGNPGAEPAHEVELGFFLPVVRKELEAVAGGDDRRDPSEDGGDGGVGGGGDVVAVDYVRLALAEDAEVAGHGDERMGFPGDVDGEAFVAEGFAEDA